MVEFTITKSGLEVGAHILHEDKVVIIRTIKSARANLVMYGLIDFTVLAEYWDRETWKNEME